MVNLLIFYALNYPIGEKSKKVIWGSIKRRFDVWTTINKKCIYKKYVDKNLIKTTFNFRKDFKKRKTNLNKPILI